MSSEVIELFADSSGQRQTAPERKPTLHVIEECGAKRISICCKLRARSEVEELVLAEPGIRIRGL